MNSKICIVYTHHKLGDLIWQLPYIKAISEHHDVTIDLILRKKTQAKNILRHLKHINNINYNDFRKGIYYWVDVLKLINIFKKNQYSHVYLLDKVNKPAIAAKISGIKNIIGPGIGNQKKWLSTKLFLDEDDWNLSYSEQSQKLLKIHNISVNNTFPLIEVDTKELNEKNSDLSISGNKISFGVDSFEHYKMWYEEDFVKLADLLHKKKLFDYIYLICGQDKSHVAKKIINKSKKKYFIDCSNKNLTGVMCAIKNSNFFVGNNSGPLNLAAALNVKSFGLIANDPVDELKFSKIDIITPEKYNNIRCREREGMRKLSVEKVYLEILKRFNL